MKVDQLSIILLNLNEAAIESRKASLEQISLAQEQRGLVREMREQQAHPSVMRLVKQLEAAKDAFLMCAEGHKAWEGSPGDYFDQLIKKAGDA